MKRKTVISLLLGFSLVLGLCSGCAAGAAEETPAPVESLGAQGEVEDKAISRNALALALLEAEYAQKGGNVILSPLSIETALAMASEGAAGEALEALEALGLKGEQGARPSQDGGEGVLSTANSMWFNEVLGGKVDQGFKEALELKYGAEEGLFTPESQSSADEINGWVREKTNQKIDAIVSAESLKEDALAVLINAVCFDGKWTEPFERPARSGEFYTPHGVETAQLMADRVRTYFEYGGFTGFSKSYQGGYEFIGILPQELGLDLEKLDIDAFLASGTGEYDVDIEIPRFELEYANSLRQSLTELGLGSLFEEGSMNAMLTPEALALGDYAQVDDVLHKTYMKMYEEGTEAAAVTSVVFTYGCTAAAPQREVRKVFLDRPFAFLIREVESGRIVFCGAVDSME